MSHESGLIKAFWKPDGKNIDQKAEARIKDWMKANGMSTDAGAITTFLHSPVHETARDHAIQKLGIKKVK